MPPAPGPVHFHCKYLTVTAVNVLHLGTVQSTASNAVDSQVSLVHSFFNMHQNIIDYVHGGDA